MATYAELRALFNDPDTSLRGKVEVAVIVAAEAVVNEDGATANHANRVMWAAQAFSNPAAEAKKALMVVLAANKAATVAQITEATDPAIQSNVDAVVDVLAGV